jgi:hypothetical protein
LSVGMEVHTGRIVEVVGGASVSVLPARRVQRATKKSVIKSEKNRDCHLFPGEMKIGASPLFLVCQIRPIGGS